MTIGAIYKNQVSCVAVIRIGLFNLSMQNFAANVGKFE